MRRLLLLLACAGIVLVAGASAAFAAGSGGVTAPSIYVNGVLYRTVGTPTDLSGTGAPDSSFETIYDFGNLQPNVAAAAPGDPGFRGGRWQVHALAYNTSYAATVAAHDANGSGNLDSTAEIAAALADPGPGGATDLGVVKLFECPVIPAN
ncbi:MAG TPA: hypothetical protein VFU64_02185 [Gaiellaceae bacterium]|nr:hypothetical protein [Gaiellaceae bacterium]